MHQLSKSIVLPILGMIILTVFIIMSYVLDSIFLDRILVCSLILSVVFIGKIRDNLHQSSSNPKN